MPMVTLFHKTCLHQKCRLLKESVGGTAVEDFIVCTEFPKRGKNWSEITSLHEDQDMNKLAFGQKCGCYKASHKKSKNKWRKQLVPQPHLHHLVCPTEKNELVSFWRFFFLQFQILCFKFFDGISTCSVLWCEILFSCLNQDCLVEEMLFHNRNMIAIIKVKWKKKI